MSCILSALDNKVFLPTMPALFLKGKWGRPWEEKIVPENNYLLMDRN
jgi:hypothetical protein